MKPSTEIDEPSLATPKSDKEAPKRTKDLSDIVLPILTMSRTDNEAPRPLPNSDTEEPMRLHVLRDTELPTWKQATIEIEEPILTKLRKAIEAPICALSTIE